jgi:hypothetical protein
MATTNLGRIGLVSRGTWSAGTYKNLDVVSYNNSLYICKVTTTTDAPTVSASWDLYVSDSGAAASATAAAASATAAAASYDSFDDRYLGSKASDPSVDNDGNALITGALYWNSTSSVMKVWSGSVWITNLTSNQFGTNVVTFLQTPSSANLAAALTDETGTAGKVVFDTNPTFPAQINLTANSGYNIYASGTANNYLAGHLGVGSATGAGQKVIVGGNLTGAANAYGQWNYLNILSDVTSEAVGFATALGTNASAFTTNISHFKAIQNAIGAGSTVSGQYGFNATSLTGAVNNYGFYGGIAAGANRYNLYMGGSADNYLAGNLSVCTTTKQGTITNYGSFAMTCAGGDSTANRSLKFYIDGTLYGGIYSPNGKSLAFQSGVTTLTDAMTIDVYGNVGIGTASPDASAILDAQSTTKGVRFPNMTTTQKNAVATPAAGLVVFDTTLSKLCVYSGAAWQTITSI